MKLKNWKSKTLLNLAGLTLVMGLTSCSKSNQSGEALSLINSSIIVNRPQAHDTQVAMLRLKLPSLFEESYRDQDGKLVVNEYLAKEIIKEQKELANKLKAISPDIQVLYTYKFVLNAIAAIVPGEHVNAVKEATGNMATFESSLPIARMPHQETTSAAKKFAELTSTNFIGSKIAHDAGIRGQKISVGIIDSGIDFTHSMLGGNGDVAEYESIDPKKTTELFPNKKVVGGVDLVGTDYDASSNQAIFYVPQPDLNPMDEGGHGTHVAGTVAGIGNQEDSYDGVAPDAKLHAIKVFGANGSTSDAVIIAALEYSADPNGDLDPKDRLDVVNLSLGSGFGTPHILYSAAVKNLVKGGVIFVASAGNSGPVPFVTGAPGTSAEGISVAASIDNMEHNWKFDAVSFDIGSEQVQAPLLEATFTVSIEEAGGVSGKLVLGGIADRDYTEEEKAKLNGNVALIDRGAVAFFDKVKRAQDAGAIGVVVANNVAGDAFIMGGGPEGVTLKIPAVMISQSLGDSLKSKMEAQDVVINFKTDDKIEKPELIDTITSFSSQGPRSYDYLLKPEITAPGQQIVSAAMGGGSKAVAMNGTSMSGPHMAGVMALLRQKYPTLDVIDLKAIAMGTAKSISDEKGAEYSLTRQGAGRVQVEKAVSTDIVVLPHSLSLGRNNLDTKKGIRKFITVTNISSEDKTYTFKGQGQAGMQIADVPAVTVPAGKSIEVPVTIILTKADEFIKLYEGRLNTFEGEKQVWTTPVLLAAQMISKNESSNLTVYSTGAEDAVGAAAELVITNKGSNSGLTLPFNLLATDSKKQSVPMEDHFRSRYCDLEAVGYRIAKTKDGEEFLQFGIKLHNPITFWNSCEISIQIDKDGDNIADQELVGISNFNLEGLGNALPQGFYSFLLDADRARAIRKTYEAFKDFGMGLNYIPAILDAQQMMAFSQSTSAVVQVQRTKLAINANNKIRIKVGTLSRDADAIESDDFVDGKKEWLEVNPKEQGMGYVDLPQMIDVPAGKSKVVSLTKGGADQDLLLLHPTNNTVLLDSTKKDTQSEILKANYAF